MLRSTLLLLFTFISFISFAQENFTVTSPDKSIVVKATLNDEGKLFYTITKNGDIVLEPSRLGVIMNDADFGVDLSVVKSPKYAKITESYLMQTGKRKQCLYNASEGVLFLKTKKQKLMNVIFQVSNDGVAFRYQFPGKSTDVKKISSELSTFNFSADTKAWLQPMSDAKTGWEQTNPSYEEYYQKEIAVGQPAPSNAGWVYPALFHTEKNWVLITEVGLDGSYCGTRLKPESKDGEYQVGFPDLRESLPGGNVYPESTLPWFTPWRSITIGSLATIVESTMGTDLAAPPSPVDASLAKPGISAWSWVLLKDDSTVYDVQKRFVDYAAQMKWKYVLVDADWDQKIGYEKIQVLADYAKTKDVGLILWYNSAGTWNTVKYTPKDKLVTAESRAAEFSRLKKIGIKGLKIDFFGGDGQSMIKYYLEILNDAKKFGFLINFHGATLPRGWQRTYPNLMTMESIKGMEFITFDQRNADEEPAHVTTIPFIRNVFDPMDFTPMALHEIPNIKRRTTTTFELATSIAFLSGIQHMAETPRGMKQMPSFVVDFIKRIPTQWDDVKFVDGYPGKLVVLARRTGNRWIVVGLNGEAQEKKVTVDLSFINASKGNCIIDSAEQKVIQQEIVPSNNTSITLQSNGGFVIEF